MYAIVKTGGKQYRVERGQTLLVERLKADEGAEMQLEPILYRSEEAIFDKEGLAGVKVTAKVLAHVRGEIDSPVSAEYGRLMVATILAGAASSESGQVVPVT